MPKTQAQKAIEGEYTRALWNVSTYEGKIEKAPRWWFDALLAGIGNSRYRLVNPIAKGGQGILLLCEDTRVDNAFVVIKFALLDMLRRDSFFHKLLLWKRGREKMPPNPISLGNTELSARFRRGITLQQQVNKIVSDKKLHQIGYTPAILEIGDKPNKLYCVMEFCGAESLMEWAQDKTFTDKLDLVHKMILFIEKAMHAFSIIHSDLKPDNILVSDVPIFLDFQIGKNMGLVEKITGKNSCQGTLAYSSDHQLNNFRDRNYKDDIFTFALTFWCVFKGDEPRNLSDQDILRLRTQYGMTEIFRPDIFQDDEGVEVTELRDIFLRAISYQDDGYVDISEMRADFEKYLSKLRRPKKEQQAARNRFIFNWEEINRVTENMPLRDFVRKTLIAADIILKD